MNHLAVQQQCAHPDFVDIQLWRSQVEAQLNDGPVTPSVESPLSENSVEDDNDSINLEQVELMELENISAMPINFKICPEVRMEAQDTEMSDMADLDQLSTSVIELE